MAITISGNGDMTGNYTFAGNVDVTGDTDLNGKLEIPAGDTASRPATGQANEIRLNTDTGHIEYWSATDYVPRWRDVGDAPVTGPEIDFLVIAGGGGGGGGYAGGGGGAGGYRTSYGSGNISGGLSAVESPFQINFGTAYPITVGVGGTGSTVGPNYGADGGDSVFATITSIGGGAGGSYHNGPNEVGRTGGSGGGSGGSYDPANRQAGGTGTTGQGFVGGVGIYNNCWHGGGGGGAGEAGQDGSNASGAGKGGDGLASSITGTSVTRAGGGGGGRHSGTTITVYDNSGAGGGGRGMQPPDGTTQPSGFDATDETGGGGGGGGDGQSGSYPGGDGGDGVIILRSLANTNAAFTAGTIVNGTTVSVDGTNVPGASISGSTDLLWTITEANGDTVTFTQA